MATSSVAITPGSGQAIAVDTNSGLASGAAVQIFSPANSDGTRQPFDPDGTPQVSPEPTSLLLDDFGAQAITVFHTVASGNSGVTPAASAGNVPVSAGTASGGYAVMRTTLPYYLRAFTYLKVAHIVQHEAAATTNSTRWWGYGSNQATPTATAPVLNGAVFQLDSSAGDLQAAIYSAGTKTIVATLTRRTDAAQHRYEIQYRQSIIYWVIDSVVVASRAFPNLAVATGLYAIAGAANAAAITAPTYNLSSVSVAEQGGNNRTISDGFNPGLQATVKTTATAIATTDNPLAVGLHPSSPLPAGTNALGSVTLGAALPAGANTIGGVNLNASSNLLGAVRVGAYTHSPLSLTTAASTNATAVRTSAGYLQELSVSNPTATAAYLKFYNKASAPTVGTDIPVMTIRIPATGAQGDFQEIPFGPNGKWFSTGIALAVTAAAAASDTAVTVAGIQIHGTYV